MQLFSQITFVAIAVLILFGLSAPLVLLCAARPMRYRRRAVDFREDALLGIEEAITVISAERRPRISQE